MKINSDLRMAVRCAYNVQKKTGNDYAAREKAALDAIEAFLKAKPKAAKALREAKARIQRANEESAAASQIIRSYGLENGWNGAQYRINDNVAFTRAGGHFEITEKVKWSFDQVMAELASAPEKDAAKILKKFGINWS